MKKNLVFSLIMVIFCAALLTGASFAYFSSGGDGLDQNISVGSFAFERADTVVNERGIGFRAPTVVNFPAVEKPVDPSAPGYDEALNDYFTEGDDENFDRTVTATLISVRNLSNSPMRLSFEITSSSASAVNFTSALRWFVFGKEESAKLKAEGKYAEALHLKCDASLPDVEGADNLTATDLRLSAGREAELASIANGETLSASSQTGDYAEYMLLMWLDYRPFSAVMSELGLTGYVKAELNIRISVTADNEGM